MEEQLELVEKLKSVGVYMTPQESLDGIEEIEDLLQALKTADKNLEHRREMMLKGKTPYSVLDDSDEPEYPFEAIPGAIIALVVIVISNDLTLRLVGAVALAICVVMIALSKESITSAASRLLDRRLVRNTKEYGRIIETQVQLRRFLTEMELKQLELLTKI